MQNSYSSWDSSSLTPKFQYILWWTWVWDYLHELLMLLQSYRKQTTVFKSTSYERRGDSNQWINASNPPMEFIEFVTSPNNPDGRLRHAVLEGPFVKTIHDHACYWPHYSAIPAPVDEDTMLFTISKLNCHAAVDSGITYSLDALNKGMFVCNRIHRNSWSNEF